MKKKNVKRKKKWWAAKICVFLTKPLKVLNVILTSTFESLEVSMRMQIYAPFCNFLQVIANFQLLRKTLEVSTSLICKTWYYGEYLWFGKRKKITWFVMFLQVWVSPLWQRKLFYRTISEALKAAVVLQSSAARGLFSNWYLRRSICWKSIR